MAEYEAGMKSLSDGVNAYVAGGNQLAGGVQSYVTGTTTLTDGMQQYIAGVNQLAGGVGQYAGGIKSLVDGIKIGREEEKRKIANSLFKEGDSIEKVARILCESEETIRGWVNEKMDIKVE